MRDRVDLINHLCRRYWPVSYLEIGCAGDDCFANIKATDKTGVDPMRGGTHRMTSDEFFQLYPRRSFHVIFVDGLHLLDQARRDVDNAEKALRDGGVIVLHDCLPPTKRSTDPAIMLDALERGEDVDSVGIWCGQVWLLLLELVARPDLDVVLWPKDFGCAVILKRPTSNPRQLESPSFTAYKRAPGDYATIVKTKAALDRWLG